MILIIVVEIDVIIPGLLASLQRTTVPFKPMLVELIANIETRGVAFLAEILMKVNEVSFTTISVNCRVISLELLNVVISSSLPCSLITLNFHSKNCTDAVHVS